MKTAPLLHRNVSKYTSQCDQGNITVVVCVIRISLYIKTGDFWENQQSKDQLLQALRPCSRFCQGSFIQCTKEKYLGASYVNCKHDIFSYS